MYNTKKYSIFNCERLCARGSEVFGPTREIGVQIGMQTMQVRTNLITNLDISNELHDNYCFTYTSTSE